MKDTGGSAPCESLSWIMVQNSVPTAFMKTVNGTVNLKTILKSMALNQSWRGLNIHRQMESQNDGLANINDID